MTRSNFNRIYMEEVLLKPLPRYTPSGYTFLSRKARYYFEKQMYFYQMKIDMSATLLDYVKLSHVSNTDIKVAIDNAIKDAVKSSLYELLDNR